MKPNFTIITPPTPLISSPIMIHYYQKGKQINTTTVYKIIAFE